MADTLKTATSDCYTETVSRSLLKQIRVRPGTDKHNDAWRLMIIDLVGQQEIAANVALAMPRPISIQGMIEPFRTQRTLISDEQEHSLFETMQIIPTRSRQSFPIFEEGLGVIHCSRQRSTLTGGGFFRGH